MNGKVSDPLSSTFLLYVKGVEHSDDESLSINHLKSKYNAIISINILFIMTAHSCMPVRHCTDRNQPFPLAQEVHLLIIIIITIIVRVVISNIIYVPSSFQLLPLHTLG